MNRSIHLVTIFDIPIEINWTWFVVFFLVTWTLAQSYFPAALPNSPVAVYWMISILAAVLFFVSLLAHELSHSIVAIKNRLPINGITLFIFGGVARMSKEPQTPKVEFIMAAAGPLCSFSISFAFFVLTQLFYNLHFPMAIVVTTDYLSVINLLVGIFNLIPGFPLDGGRILRSALWSLTGDIKRATEIASFFGKLFAYFLIGFGFLYLFYGAVLSGIWLIFIGFFLQEAASTSYQQVAMKQLLSGAKVQDIMSKDVVTVREDLTLHSLVEDYFFKFRFTSFPVISAEGAIKGIITVHAVKDIHKNLWHSTKIKDAMVPLAQNLIVHPNKDVFEALTQMAGNGVGRLLVTQNGKLIGIISQRDVIRLFEVKEGLGE
jgi:Zn-dependent protease/CBS domain-containing protein